MAKLSEEFINEVISKSDIVDVISEKVALSKKGKSYFGLCPFHQEKTPSFSVEPERKIFNCFSCGEKGNVVTFLQKVNNISFIEAIEDLAIRANITKDFSEFKTENKHQRLFDINDAAKTLYQLYLSSTKSGLEAKKYLINRGINQDIIKRFDLGLASDQFDLLHKTLVNQGYLVSDLFDLGLVKKSKNDTFYDLFRERIIFPIKDEKGNTVAFSGRTYKEEDDSAKYINSPQTKVFTKSNTVYNLHQAIPEIKRQDRVLLFEGYMDVIAAYRAGLHESVASMGTSLTYDQVKLLKRYTDNVYICYDGDPAGIDAASRALIMFKNEQMNPKIVVLPDGMDPDDYISKHGNEALQQYILNNWDDPIEFEYKKQNMNIDFDKMLDIEHFKQTIFDLIRNASNTVIETYINKLALDMKISPESIRQDFNQYTKRNLQNIQQIHKRKINILDKFAVAERRLVNYYLADKKYVFNYNVEFSDQFHLNDHVRTIKFMLEDMYIQDATKNLEPVKIREKLFEQLNEAQKLFFLKECENKHLELSTKEFSDLKDTMNEFQDKLIIDRLNKQIALEPTIKGKIKLAQIRDQKIKEDKHGPR